MIWNSLKMTIHTIKIGNKMSENLAPSKNAADVLSKMAETFRERNSLYGNNYKMVGPIMNIFWPDGVPSELVVKDQFHLFELIIVKLSRFAISNLTHEDSIHDSSVYGAMIEAILIESDKSES